MPSIDVNDVLISLDIANQTFSVIRRLQTKDHGRTVTNDTVVPNVRGAVQPIGDNSLLREEQYTSGNNAITVWTQYRLRAASHDGAGNVYQPDLILWNGDYYMVRVLDEWTDFGPGYVRAECIATAYVPNAPV